MNHYSKKSDNLINMLYKLMKTINLPEYLDIYMEGVKIC